MLKKVDHCKLCNHRDFDMIKGNRCGLSGKKPEFTVKCSSILFENKMIEHIRNVEVAHAIVLRTKFDTIINLIVYGFIALAIIVAGYLIGKFAWDKGVLSTVPLIIISAGVGVLPLASGPVNRYIHSIKIVKKDKAKLESVLKLYSIKYFFDVKIKDVHGMKNVQGELTYKNKRHHFNYDVE